MRALERFLLLQIIDQRWREHLHDMDYLREGIHLRGLAQLDPLVAYKNEAFTLFGDLMNLVWLDFARMIYHVQVTVAGGCRVRLAARRRRSAAPEPALELVHRRRPRQLFGWRRADAAHRRWPRQRPRGAEPGARRRACRGCAGRRRRGRAAASRRRKRAGAQRSLLVRVGQEVQEVPRRLT